MIIFIMFVISIITNDLGAKELVGTYHIKIQYLRN